MRRCGGRQKGLEQPGGECRDGGALFGVVVAAAGVGTVADVVRTADCTTVADALSGALDPPAAAREFHAELLQLAIQVRALEPGAISHPRHAETLARQMVFEVNALELVARLAQRLVQADSRCGRGRCAGP